MAETLVSPGVLQRENDRSFVAPAPVEVGAAIVGPTVKGPVEIPTVVTSFGDFREKFGTSFLSGSTQYEFLTSISAQKYFAEGGQSLLVTRVTPGDFTEATSTRILANSGSIDAGYATASVDFSGNLPANFEGFGVFNNSDQIQFLAISSSFTQTTGTNIYYKYGTGFDQAITGLVAEINSNNLPFTANSDGDTISITSSVAGTGPNEYVIKTGSLSELFSPSGLTNIADFGGGSALLVATNTDDNI